MFGEWGAVCDDGFTPREGEIVCKQLGYNLGVEKVMFYKIFGKNKVSKNRVFRILKSNIHDCSNIKKTFKNIKFPVFRCDNFNIYF